MTLTGLTGTTYKLDPIPFGSGGEGDVYRVIDGDDGETIVAKVAKVYKGAFARELIDKLLVMIRNPPNDSVLSQVAWPLDLVSRKAGAYCGFIMPELSINSELGEIYKYPAMLPISTAQKINIAQNICVVISEIHKAGYVFGDFNPRNIGLDISTGLVSFLDTDTYHVVDHEKDKAYRCTVCASGYSAPELLEKCSDYLSENPTASKNAYAETPLPTFTKETDNFALAIHIFKLLMNGYTPFGGVIEASSVSQSSPGLGDAAVRRNSYCFRPGYKPQSTAIPPLETLPEEIADLFTRAFIEGRVDPQKRPDAIEWHSALSRFDRNLMDCSENPLHQYDRKNAICPLCEADRRYETVVPGRASVVTLKQTAYAPLPVAVKSQTMQPPEDDQNMNVRLSAPARTPLKLFLIVSAIVLFLIAATFLDISTVNKNSYTEAVRLFNSRHFMSAKRAFFEISTYKNSAEWILACDYHYAYAMLSAGNFAVAKELFSGISSYLDSEVMVIESDYLYAQHLLFTEGNYSGAKELLILIHPYKDTEELIKESDYQYAIHLLFNTGNYTESGSVLRALHPYKDSADLITESDYQYATSLLFDYGDYMAARNVLLLIQPYQNTEDLIKECDYLYAKDCFYIGDFEEALNVLIRLDPYGDETEELIKECNYLSAQYHIGINNPQEARRLLQNIPGYRDSDEMIKEIDYNEGIALKSAGELLRSADVLKRLGTFRDSQTQLAEVLNLIYSSAVEDYRRGNYENSEIWFSETTGIGNTDKFLTLIKVRQGQVINKETILALIGFEDMNEVIKADDYLFLRFLGMWSEWGVGRKWSDADGNYIRFYTNDGWDGFMSATVTMLNFELHQIENGVHYGYNGGASRNQWTPLWEYTIISQNSIRIYYFHDGRNYTLDRSN